MPENWPKGVGNRLQRMAEAWIVRSSGLAAGSGTERSSSNRSDGVKSGRAACDQALGPGCNRRTAIDSRFAASSMGRGLPLRTTWSPDKLVQRPERQHRRDTTARARH